MNDEKQLLEQDRNEETEIDLLEIFYLLRAKMKWLILMFVVGALIFGSFTYFLITPKYTATAKMYMISASSGSVLDLSDFNIGTSLSQDYTELIKIRPVFNEVIDNLNLNMEYEELMEKVSISVVGDSRLLAVSVEDEDPKMAQKIVNELVDTAVTYIPKVMNASENAKPTIAEYAVVPDQKSSPNMAKNTILGAVLAMLLGAAYFIIRMLMDDSLNTAEDVEKAFGVMPLTVIPEGTIEEISDEVEKNIKKDKKKRKRK
jgi:capsular polysaccharide biosynthesis protein|uniref:YveK family protein n=1 Tax=Agathobacter sp. TaxID=2021311 RepID=UPI004026DF17